MSGEVNSALLRTGFSGTPYLPAANLVFQSFTTPPTAARKSAINALIADLISAGVWTLIDIFYIIAAADSQAARINWKTPGTYTLSIGAGSPTFAADRGYTGDGTASYLSTGFDPSVNGVNYVLNTAFIGAWARAQQAASTNLVGRLGATQAMGINARSVTNNCAVQLNGAATTLSVAMSTAIGFTVAERSSSSARAIYKNGLSVATDAQAASGPTTSAIILLANNGTSFSTNEIAAFAAGGSLGAAGQLALYTALARYMAFVGA